jgi:hypothetical protein
VHLFTQQVQIPLVGAQAVTQADANGNATAQIGPTGLGTVWYPVSAVVSTSSGPLDGSTCSVYVGPVQAATTLQGTLVASGGAGVVSLAIPQLTPGATIAAVWSNAQQGAICTLNVTGTTQVLSR